jgi:hypothetical protein
VNGIGRVVYVELLLCIRYILGWDMGVMYVV